MVNQTPPLLAYLETKGITLQALIDCALEMYVPHPGIRNRRESHRSPQRRIPRRPK